MNNSEQYKWVVVKENDNGKERAIESLRLMTCGFRKLANDAIKRAKLKS